MIGHVEIRILRSGDLLQTFLLGQGVVHVLADILPIERVVRGFAGYPLISFILSKGRVFTPIGANLLRRCRQRQSYCNGDAYDQGRPGTNRCAKCFRQVHNSPSFLLTFDAGNPSLMEDEARLSSASSIRVKIDLFVSHASRFQLHPMTFNQNLWRDFFVETPFLLISGRIALIAVFCSNCTPLVTTIHSTNHVILNPG